VNLVSVKSGAKKAALRFESGGGDFKTVSLK
jgi:hypothetical protein